MKIYNVIIYYKGGDGLRNQQLRKHYEWVGPGKTHTWKSELTILGCYGGLTLGKSQRKDRKWKLIKGVSGPRISA